MTQALSEHGCFKLYLNRGGLTPDVKSLYCNDLEDTAKHTIF